MWIGEGNELGQPIPISAEHAEGLDLLRKHPAMDEAKAYVLGQATESVGARVEDGQGGRVERSDTVLERFEVRVECG